MTVLFSPDLLIWTNATGSYATTTTPCLNFFVGYDASGDAFVDGESGCFAELKKGSTTWTSLTTSPSIGFPGGVQWDGTYITVNDQLAAGIYRFTCTGTSCTNAGTVPLTGSGDCDDPWIKGAVVACGDIVPADLKLYHYPAGGSPYATITGQDGPIGSVILK
jgi:hypothetical protein